MTYFNPRTDPALFRCGCERPACDAPPPTQELLDRLDLMRYQYGYPIVITSGPRCATWNLKKGGKANSDHRTGEGADLDCPGSRARFELYDAARRAGFRRLGIGRNFLHVGTAERLDQDVTWTYYPKETP